MKRNLIWLAIVGMFWSTIGLAEEKESAEKVYSYLSEIGETVWQDHKNFYSGKNLFKLGGGLVTAGILAHSPADEEIRDWYQESVRDRGTDKFADLVKPFGEGEITIPIYLGAALLGELAKDTEVDSPIGEWGQRCLRATLVGVPPLLILQRGLGASRPDENDSHWRPFNDSNGVSGHNFMGAVPFIVAAKMTDKPYLKYPLYMASTLCGLSRINDDKHYFSQIVLGWWLAYLAADSVFKTEKEKEQKLTIAPMFLPGKGGGGGIIVTYRF